MARVPPMMPRMPKNATLDVRISMYESYINLLKPGFLPKLPADMPAAERKAIYKKHMNEWREQQRRKWKIIWSVFGVFVAVALIIAGVLCLVL